MPMRLPYLPEREVADARRPLYDAFADNVGKNFPTITTRRPDGSLLGPWGVWMQVPDVGEPFLDLIRNIRGIPGLGDRVKQVVILTVAARYDAAYEIYAHTSAARGAGLPEARVAALLAGERPEGLDGDEAIAHDIAVALLGGGVLPRPLYDLGLAEFGQDGLNAVIFTVAQYSFVAVMLNAYDVPDETDTDEGTRGA